MSQENESIIPEDLIFYVDKLEDDFTFYLDAELHKDVEKIKPLFKTVKSRKAERDFSVSEQILFTNLIPSKKSPEIKSALWARLRDPTDDAGGYLLRKLQAAASSNEDHRKLVDILTTSAELSDDEKKSLGDLLLIALSPQNRADLVNEEWVRTRELSPEQIKALDHVGAGDSRKITHSLLETLFPELKWAKPKGRALICLSHVGKGLSVTVRKLKDEATYEPKSYPSDPNKRSENRRQWLFSVAEYCAPIKEGVFWKTEPASQHGLLVITGPTKSLKSEITRGLIYRYLEEKKDGSRIPHLVTFEDPIEMYFAEQSFAGQPFVALPLNDQQAGINYTPRQKPKDVGLLKDALSDALRQTPTVFFVGETRSKEEWEVLLDFAATGHLVVTTAHAGSLVEAMRKIFEAREVKTAADRGEIANKLLAVVNLKPSKIKIDAAGQSTEVIFPALWRSTSRGVAALTSDGLSALLPHPNTANLPSCLGRKSFIDCLLDRLLKEAVNDLELAFGAGQWEQVTKTARKQASKWDLQGV
jgi:hypothetical protein